MSALFARGGSRGIYILFRSALGGDTSFLIKLLRSFLVKIVLRVTVGVLCRGYVVSRKVVDKKKSRL